MTLLPMENFDELPPEDQAEIISLIDDLPSRNGTAMQGTQPAGAWFDEIEGLRE